MTILFVHKRRTSFVHNCLPPKLSVCGHFLPSSDINILLNNQFLTFHICDMIYNVSLQQ